MDYEKEIIDLKNDLLQAYDKIYKLTFVITQIIENSGLPEDTKREYLDAMFRI